MLVLEDRRFFRRGDPTGPNPSPYTLSEDVTILSGSYILCRVENVRFLFNKGTQIGGDRGGQFDLYREGGNVRGLYVNGTKLDSFVYQLTEPLAFAEEINSTVYEKGGDEVLEAWWWTIEHIIANPTVTQAQWAAAFDAWADSVNNMVDGPRALTRIRNRWWPTSNFAEIRDDILAYDLPTWKGRPTQVIEEYS